MNKLLGHHLLNPEEVAGGDEKPVVKPDISVKSEHQSAPTIEDSDDEY